MGQLFGRCHVCRRMEGKFQNGQRQFLQVMRWIKTVHRKENNEHATSGLGRNTFWFGFWSLSRPCVSVIIRRVTRAITVHLGPNYIKLPDCETNFINRFSTPQCLGAIDGTRCNKTASRKLTLTGKVTIRLKHKLAPTTGTASRTL